MIILLDTSSIELISEKKKGIADILESTYDEKIEYLVTKGVVKELEEHSEEKGIRGRSAKLGLAQLKRLEEQKRLKRHVEPPEYAWSTDDALIKAAVDMKGIILTQDNELRKKAGAQGVKSITYRRSGTIGD
jgi:rRNA-processing protein FCF1